MQPSTIFILIVSLLVAILLVKYAKEILQLMAVCLLALAILGFLTLLDMFRVL